MLTCFALQANAQKPNGKLDTEVLEFYKRIEGLYGTVFIDTAYSSYDTAKLKKAITNNELKDGLCTIKLLGLKPVSFTYRAISGSLHNIVSLDSFFKVRNVIKSYTNYEAVYNSRLDSFFQVINKPANREDLPKRTKKVEELLIESSYWKIHSEGIQKSKNKLFKILSIFESDNYLLFVYTISELHSTVHTSLKYELIIK